MKIQVVSILCLHHPPTRLLALRTAFLVVWVFWVFLVCFFILACNYSLKPYSQKLTNITSWVIIYLPFFQMCGFELLLLGKHQKVFNVQVTLTNSLQPQLSAFQVIIWFFFFRFAFQEIGIFCFIRGFVLEGSQDCHLHPYSRDSDITVCRYTKYWE